MMYELTIERSFSAAHQLRDYDGPCARLHGHNYRVQITVGGERLAANGMLLDFGDLKAICDAILHDLDHRCLNELPDFAEVNPTAENIAAFIHGEVAERLPSDAVTIRRVSVWESDGSCVTYREDV